MERQKPWPWGMLSAGAVTWHTEPLLIHASSSQYRMDHQGDMPACPEPAAGSGQRSGHASPSLTALTSQDRPLPKRPSVTTFLSSLHLRRIGTQLSSYCVLDSVTNFYFKFLSTSNSGLSLDFFLTHFPQKNTPYPRTGRPGLSHCLSVPDQMSAFFISQVAVTRLSVSHS